MSRRRPASLSGSRPPARFVPRAGAVVHLPRPHPDNIVSWLTVRNYGFSDATEIFVFISGYTAVIAYSRMMAARGLGARRRPHLPPRLAALRRAHPAVRGLHRPDRLGLDRPRHAGADRGDAASGPRPESLPAILEAALLKFRPVNLDVLPLYIVLLAVFPLALPALLRWPLAVIAVSLGVYAATLPLRLEPAGLPRRQGLVLQSHGLAGGVLCRRRAGGGGAASSPGSTAGDGRFRCWPSLYLAFAAFIALSWHYNSLERLIPDWLARQIYPIDKTNLDILRFVHFLAIAWLVRLGVRPDAAFLKWRIFEPIRRCGEHSLQIFCLGTFLAVTAQIIVGPLRRFDRVADSS